MSGRRGLSRITLPLRALVERFAFGVLLLTSVLLLLLGKADLRLGSYISNQINDTLGPVVSLVSQPTLASRALFRELGELFAIRESNELLRAENGRLRAQVNEARQLLIDNDRLRKALNVVADRPSPVKLSARIIADHNGPFIHTILVNAGTDDGIEQGIAVVNERGLVGHVIDAGQDTSRVLLLNDLSSQIPVMVEPSGDRGVLVGGHEDQPSLIFLPLSPAIAVGNRIVTSGHGGVLPRGVAIGHISSISEQRVKVQTLVDWDRLDYVSMLLYETIEEPFLAAGDDQ